MGEKHLHPRKNLVHRSYNQFIQSSCVSEVVQDIFFSLSHLPFFFFSISMDISQSPPSIHPSFSFPFFLSHHPPPFLLTSKLLPAPAPDPEEEILSGLKIPLEPPPPPPPPAPVPPFPIRGLLM